MYGDTLGIAVNLAIRGNGLKIASCSHSAGTTHKAPPRGWGCLVKHRAGHQDLRPGAFSLYAVRDGLLRLRFINEK